MLVLSAPVLTQLFNSGTFWLQQNHGADISRFLVATNVEIRQKICHDMQHLFTLQDSLTLSVWIVATTSNS